MKRSGQATAAIECRGSNGGGGLTGRAVARQAHIARERRLLKGLNCDVKGGFLCTCLDPLAKRVGLGALTGLCARFPDDNAHGMWNRGWRRHPKFSRRRLFSRFFTGNGAYRKGIVRISNLYGPWGHWTNW